MIHPMNKEYWDNIWKDMSIEMALDIYKLRCGKLLGTGGLCTWGGVAKNIIAKYPKNVYGEGGYAGRELCRDAQKKLTNLTKTEKILYGPIEYLEELD